MLEAGRQDAAQCLGIEIELIENRTDPMLAALSMLLIVTALAIVLMVERAAGLTRTLSKE